VENQAELLHNRGLANYRMGASEEAVVDFTEAIALREGYTRAVFNRGVVNYDAGNYRDAIEDFRRVIESEPENAQALYNLGAAYIRVSENVGDPDTDGAGEPAEASDEASEEASSE
jgi:tetratricopeptide (TPR) repeat protein